MNNLKIKEIELMNLKDDTLMKVLKFNPYDCDKVIFKYNDDISEEDISKKIMYLSNIYCELLKLLHDKYHDWKFDKNKHDNIWMDIKTDNLNEIISVGTEIDNISSAILMLNGDIFDVHENVTSMIYDKFEKVNEQNHWLCYNFII